MNTTFQYLWNSDKGIFKGKSTALFIAFNRGEQKENKKLISIQHKKLEKEKQSKPKLTRRKIYQREEKKSMR